MLIVNMVSIYFFYVITNKSAMNDTKELYDYRQEMLRFKKIAEFVMDYKELSMFNISNSTGIKQDRLNLIMDSELEKPKSSELLAMRMFIKKYFVDFQLRDIYKAEIQEEKKRLKKKPTKQESNWYKKIISLASAIDQRQTNSDYIDPKTLEVKQVTF